MRLLTLTLLTVTACSAQLPAPPAAGAPGLTVPAGTKVPLRLTSPLGTKTARTGDAVHAEVAFPVTAGNTVAIPPGTYLDGVVDQITRRGSRAGFTMHFTHMVFNNGYTVSLTAATGDTRAALEVPPDPNTPVGAMSFQSTTPTLSQPSMPGPGKGVIIGVGVGAIVAGTVVGILLARRGGELYLHAGWRFEMVLADPLSLDGVKVAAAVANPAPR